MSAGGIAIAGAITGLVGNLIKSDAQQKGFAAQAVAGVAGENVRELQMKFETNRKKRQQVREAVLARSMSLTAASNQGALYGSGIKGGVASAATQAAENVQTSNVSEILGVRTFRANKAYHVASANAQAQMGVGGGIADIGSALFNSSTNLNNLFGG